MITAFEANVRSIIKSVREYCANDMQLVHAYIAGRFLGIQGTPEEIAEAVKAIQEAFKRIQEKN